ncbi:MAG: CCA tRNA nucleotidyltransferase [Bacteroidetes bacterium]|nr:CCA tRNA nucleotidyltransferase [Bacteroidota bacterium]
MINHLNHNIFKLISEVSFETKTPVWVIGGYVRDLLLKRRSKDIDILVLGNGLDFARELAHRIDPDIKPKYFKNFGTAMLRYDGMEIEFVGARKESYRADSRKPIVESGTLEDDQNRRDFTINAMAMSLQKENYEELIDPFNGLQDLHDKVIRTPLDPDITFSDDPLRMMRAIRFASQLKFDIHIETFEAIKRNVNRIKIVSNERVNEELSKIILSDKPSRGFKMLDESGLLHIIFPLFMDLKGSEIIDGKGHKNNFYHTLQVLDNIAEKTDDLWLRWAAILHDIAKPATKKFDPKVGWTFHAHEFLGAKLVPKIFKQMKLPLNEKMEFVKKMVLLHLRPIVLAEEIVSDSAVRRLLYEAGDDIDALMTLCEADITSKNETKVRKYMKNFELVRKKLVEIEEKDKMRNWQPPISGEIIMETFNIMPGKEVGIIKKDIREAILDGIIHNDFDAAFTLMLEIGKELGLTDARTK